jgi:hypothetical protein
VFELELDIQRILDALKLRRNPLSHEDQHFYVTRPVSTGSPELIASPTDGLFLRLCDGRHSVNDVIMQLSDGIN